MNTIFSYAVICTLLICTWPQARGESRLDVPLPREATCLIKLGTGPEMRVPLQVMRASSCFNAKGAVPVELFAMDISYPDMKPGPWLGAMDRIYMQIAGTDIMHVEKFPVRVVYVFYPEQFRNPSLDDWSGPNPQVWQIKARNRLDNKLGDKLFEPIIYESKVKGLRMMSYAPRPANPPSSPGGRYDQARGVLIEPAGADYDLLMNCDATVECLAFVQLNASHVQYRFLMPTEAVNHASDVIRDINRMIELWISRGAVK